MTIEWNRVTWYSKLLAVVIFVATFFIGFYLGISYEQVQVQSALSEIPVTTDGNTLPDTTDTTSTPVPSGAPVVGAGAHCGGFIKDAPVCAAGYHCQLKVSMPDTGGTCVSNAVVQSTTTVTSADDQGTVQVKKNDLLNIMLGSDLHWNISFAPDSAVMLVTPANATTSSQGIYKVVQSGTILLTGTGAPICPAGSACPQFLRQLKVTIVASN